MFSDEANFHVNGHVNKQNCWFWYETRARQKHQRPLHSPKVVMCASISARGIIGPYFYENKKEFTVSVKAESYCQMLQEFSVPDHQKFHSYNSKTWF